MSDDSGQYGASDTPVSRRTLLQLTGSAAVVGSAGLTSGATEGNESSRTGSHLQDVTKANSATTAGRVRDVTRDGDTFTISAENADLRVIFYGSNVFRIWLSPDGAFRNPANDGSDENSEDIVVSHDFADAKVDWTTREDYHEFSTEAVSLRAHTEPLRFELYSADGTHVWSESDGITWSEEGAVQRLDRTEDEQFFGGGMQNGRFSHRGETIDISRSLDWNDGGHPNPAPLYMSTAGYGVFRNTYAPGQYAFTDPVESAHDEQRFDAYYFYGPGLKEILDGYTRVTGRPFMPPIYGLEFGDADCYNDGEESTYPTAVEEAEKYVEYDMPRGWMLVNDGYGCGYVQLPRVVDELLNRNIRTGLWTQDGLPNQEYEINLGVRVRKLDVAWVGAGYEFAMNAAQKAYDGIERYSDARGYVWMVEGWAGAQRHAVMWTGDQTGDWKNIEFHIPTLHGSGNSAQWVGSDVDGIFGGSAETYTRDLQWKMFTPTFLGMSGWAPNDKQPWVYGEPYTSINRDYLRLRERLLPYFYTYAAEMHRSGAPMTRSLVLEYPEDPRTWDSTCEHEFLAGESFLVAPVYEDSETRDGIYLPEDRWVDYWSGNVHEGPRIVNGYHAPLDRLPLFVRAGAIIPMWPEGINNHREVADDARITLDVYPKGESNFTLYEDDGVSQDYREDKFAEQTISVTAPETGRGKVDITVGPSQGEYDGKPAKRPYQFIVHTGSEPANVRWNGEKLDHVASESEYDDPSRGWYYDDTDRGGVVRIKTNAVSTDTSHSLSLRAASAVGGPRPVESTSPVLVDPNVPADMNPEGKNEVTATFVNGRDHKKLHKVDLSLSTPDGWEVETPGATSFKHVDAGETVIGTYLVSPSTDAYGEGSFDISVDATYTVRGKERTVWDGESTDVGLKPAPPTTDTWASNLEWESTTNGWGPVERDMSNGSLNANDGQPITLDGEVYEKGLGVHAYSSVEYYLAGNCSRFTADIGVDDEIPDYGSVIFHVFADGEEIFTSDVYTGTSSTGTVDVSIEGADYVDLVVTNADDGKTGDHADWAGAKFHVDE